MLEDRRVRRTDDPQRALALLLSAHRVREGAHTIAVSNSDGALLAGAGDGAILIAALAAKIDAGENTGVSIAVQRVQIGERRFVVASLGAPIGDDVESGVRRILSVHQEGP